MRPLTAPPTRELAQALRGKEWQSQEWTYWLLAMVHWQLADENEARTWSEKAIVEREAKGEFLFEEAHLFEIRAEAVELLGI